MVTKIGIVAGEIWRHLDEKEASTLSEIYSLLDHSNEIVLMSIGWLTREGHIVLKKEGTDFKISLRSKNPSNKLNLP